MSIEQVQAKRKFKPINGNSNCYKVVVCTKGGWRCSLNFREMGTGTTANQLETPAITCALWQWWVGQFSNTCRRPIKSKFQFWVFFRSIRPAGQVLGDSSNCISIVYFNCQDIVYPNLMSLFVFVWPINHLLSVSQKHDFAPVFCRHPSTHHALFHIQHSGLLTLLPASSLISTSIWYSFSAYNNTGVSLPKLAVINPMMVSDNLYSLLSISREIKPR